jgi:hypothetical protein
MTDRSEAQAASSMNPVSVRILDAARAVECVALVAGAGFTIATLPLPASFLGAALVGMAAVLRPRERVSSVDQRIEMRRQLVQRLTGEALELRMRYAETRKLPLGQHRADVLWTIRRDITVWLAQAPRRISRYPEIAGILNAHRATGGLVDELDGALQRLGEIRRLCSISEKLKLPF